MHTVSNSCTIRADARNFVRVKPSAKLPWLKYLALSCGFNNIYPFFMVKSNNLIITDFSGITVKEIIQNINKALVNYEELHVWSIFNSLLVLDLTTKELYFIEKSLLIPLNIEGLLGRQIETITASYKKNSVAPVVQIVIETTDGLLFS